MFLIGLTGGIASGKTTVASMLKAYGAEEIDADQVSREVVEPQSLGLKLISEEFGSEILQENGSLNRTKLAGIVFSDSAKRLKLEQLLHPLIRERTQELIANSQAEIVVYSVPLLVESGVDHNFDLVVTVEAGEETQVARMVASRGLSEKEARKRLKAQASKDARIARADYTLDSSGTVEQLQAQVDVLWHKIIELAKAKKASHAAE